MAQIVNPIPLDYLFIPQGGVFEASWHVDDATTGLPPDWTGWSALMQIRAGYGGTLLATLSSNIGADGGIALEDAGNITARLESDFTSTLTPTTRSSAVWDLELTDPDGATWRVVEGKIAITPEVTTDA